MAQAIIESDALKEAMKAALVETLREHRELFQELIAEALEDYALAAAIREGQTTKEVDRHEVFELLRDKS